MSEKLLESDFFTIDLQSLFGNNDSEEKPASKKASGDTGAAGTEKGAKKAKGTEPAKTSSSSDLDKISDWKAELKTRIDENQALDPDARLPRADIEDNFWKDFFTYMGFDEDVIKILKDIDLFKKDTKILGFTLETNPILNFFKLEWVQNELIKAGLITNETYKAIHNAKAKKYVADSEFRSNKNDYNILYCRDLYANRTASDMDAYLKLQKLNLPTNVDYYDKDRKSRNISIFLVIGNKSVRQKGAKLNKLKEVEKLLGKNGITVPADESVGADESGKGNGKGNKPLSRQTLINIVNSLLSDRQHAAAQAQAALQFISMTTNNESAKKALQNDAFKNTNAQALMTATIRLSKAFSGITISKTEADQLVELLLSGLSNI